MYNPTTQFYRPVPPVGGYGYYPGRSAFYRTPATPTLKQGNVLDENAISQLQKSGGKIDFLPTQNEIWESMCTHIHNGTTSMVKDDPNDPNSTVYRCTICGQKVDTAKEYNPKDIQSLINYLEDATNILKVRNNGVIKNDQLADLGQAMVVIRRIPAMMEVVDNAFVKANKTVGSIYNGWQNSGATALGLVHGTGGFGAMPQMYGGAPIMQSTMIGNPLDGGAVGSGPYGQMTEQDMGYYGAGAPVPPPNSAEPYIGIDTNGDRVWIDPMTGQAISYVDRPNPAPVAPPPGYGYRGMTPRPVPVTPPGAVGTVVPDGCGVMHSAPVNPPVAPAPTAAPATPAPQSNLVHTKDPNGGKGGIAGL